MAYLSYLVGMWRWPRRSLPPVCRIATLVTLSLNKPSGEAMHYGSWPVESRTAISFSHYWFLLLERTRKSKRRPHDRDMSRTETHTARTPIIVRASPSAKTRACFSAISVDRTKDSVSSYIFVETPCCYIAPRLHTPRAGTASR